MQHGCLNNSFISASDAWPVERSAFKFDWIFIWMLSGSEVLLVHVYHRLFFRETFMITFNKIILDFQTTWFVGNLATTYVAVISINVNIYILTDQMLGMIFRFSSVTSTGGHFILTFNNM